MPRRPADDIEAIVEEIASRMQEERRDNVLTFSANDVATELGISENTAAKIMRRLGAVYDGYYWYIPEGE